MRAGAVALPAVLLLLASPAATAAGPELPASLGLHEPLCAGSFLIRPFDYGGDGITDLVLIGQGEMQGGERLYGYDAMHLVVRQPDGGWRRLQTHAFDYGAYDGLVQDLDGDGLDDLVLQLQHLHAHWPIPIVFFRQEPGRGLVECGRDAVEGDEFPMMYPLPRAVLLTYPRDSRRRGRLVRWSDAERAPRVVWDAELPSSSEGGAFPTNRGGMLISGARPDTLRIDDFDETGFVGTRIASWGASNYFHTLRRVRMGSYDALWYSLASSPDTIRVLFASADGESLASRSIAMPEGTNLQGPVLPAPGGAWICPAGWVSPLERSLEILRVDVERAEVAVDTLTGMAAGPQALLWNGDGKAEILFEHGGVWSAVAPDLWRPAEPDFRIVLEGLLGTGDVDGDGVLDCVVLARDEADDLLVALLRGLGHAPWFNDAMPVGPYSYGSIEVQDIDGDGRNEIISARDQQDQAFLDVQRWTGWRLEPVPDAHQTVGAHYSYWRFEDFDADGRAEAYFGSLCVRWDGDCRPLPPLEITGDVPGYWFEIITDLDGDRGSEIVTSRSATVYATHIDLETGSYQRAGTWLAPFAPDDAIAVNLDADRAMELCLVGDEGHVLWDFPQGLKSPPVVVGAGPDLLHGLNQSGDLDADGHADLYSLSSSFRMLFDLQGDRSRALYMSDVLLSESLLSERFLDIDEDGDPDLLFLGQRGVYVRLNDRIAARSGGVPLLQVRFASAHPARGFPRLAFRMSRPGPLEARLFDVTGRALWKMTQDVDTADWVELVVAPRSGGRTASGVYFLRVEGGGHAETRRIVFLP